MHKMTSTWWLLGGAFATCLALAASRTTGGAPPSPRTVAPEANAPVRQAESVPARLPVAPLPQPGADVYAVELAVQQARARGAGENEAYRLRAAALSAQTIAMLTEREQAEIAWKLRVQAWHAERVSLNHADAAALRQRRFSAEEQIQLDAAEQSGAPKLILDLQ